MIFRLYMNYIETECSLPLSLFLNTHSSFWWDTEKFFCMQSCSMLPGADIFFLFISRVFLNEKKGEGGGGKQSHFIFPLDKLS